MKHLTAGAIVLACLTLPARAIFFESFDSYAPGSQLHGQGGWVGWGGSPGAGALISNAVSYSPGNSVAVTGATDLTHWFSGYTSGQYRISSMQYIPSTSAGTTYWIWLNVGENNWSMEFNFDLTGGTVMDDLPFASPSLPIVKDQWVELRADVDLNANTVTSYYNGTPLSTHAWFGGAQSIAQIDLFANGSDPVYYDDIAIGLIPEPATMCLLAVGGGLALIRRRRG